MATAVQATGGGARAYDERMRFYTTARIGPKRSTTKEGYLICEDVPLARVGTMEYGPGETPIRVGRDNRGAVSG